MSQSAKIASWIGCALLASTSAFSADLPQRPVYKAESAPAQTWTGFYIGGTAGAASTTTDSSLSAAGPYLDPWAAPFSSLGSTRSDKTTGIFGGKIGYNYQLTNQWVIGLETDFSSLRLNNSYTISGNPYPQALYGSNFTNAESADWFGTLRGRVGYAHDRVLYYGTGGIAYGHHAFSSSLVDISVNGSNYGYATASNSGTSIGWSAGAGVDYALTNNWIISVEYLHADLGHVSASGLITTGVPVTAVENFRSTIEFDSVRAGLAYKF